MVLAVSRQRSLSQIAFVLWLGLTGAGLLHTVVPASAQRTDSCLDCHSRQKDNTGQVVAIFQTSTHARAGIGCDRCHGGDLSQVEKTKAHAGHFISRPDATATLEICGRCHRQPLEFFKSSRHLAARPNAARLDCVECHGVHAIGAYSDSFRWTQFCAGCHGLEYLPALPRPFQEVLALVDDLNDGIHRIEQKGSVPPDLIHRRKDIRHMISQLVHKTDSKGGAETIPHILDSGTTLKQYIRVEQEK